MKRSKKISFPSFLRTFFMILAFSFVASLVLYFILVNKQTWKDLKTKLDDIDIPQLVNSSDEDFRLFNQTLEKIMVPRVVDTPSHAGVRSFIVNYLKDLDWTVEENQFKDQTPLGEKTFTNIIGTLNPGACKRLVLSCHYDSKYFPFEFLAATDSAVPCTMILELVRILDTKLKAAKTKNDNITLQVIFFDGEEAFEEWTRTDSLYGSRHLASKMNSQLMSRSNGECSTHPNGPNILNHLNRIDLFILLDLIGEASPQFCNHFHDTKTEFERLTKIEKKLNSLKLLETKRRSGTSYFPTNCRNYYGRVDDDHVPFQEKDVPILHLITTPFPQSWHRASDNGKNLHHPTINNLMKIMRLFLVEYLNLTRS